MAISAKDIIPLTTARTKLTDLCEEVHTQHTEKILAKNGERCAALIGADRLDHYHHLEREHLHIALILEAARGIKNLRSRKLLKVKQLKARHGR